MRRAVLVLALAATLALAAAGVALAQTPITVSEHSNRETGTFTGNMPCQGDKLYTITITANEFVRFTAAGLDEDGNPIPPVHFHNLFIGKFVAVPVNGKGPTYYAHGREGETYNAKSFEEFVGTYTDIHKVTARGTDGSKINYRLLVRYSVNAKGEVTVQFVRIRPDESCLTPGE